LWWNCRSLLEEDEYHKLADSTIHDLQEKFENQVLTLKLGNLGTFVLNKQTPNSDSRLSMSQFLDHYSSCSGPSRFDWDKSSRAWVYRHTKANLLWLLESEVEQSCGEPISIS
ncbi:hypothetical protein IFM89_034098, partial [Coptis chinensis]